jgi:GH18 family chitinase
MINMGVAFYGHSQTGATGLYGSTSCTPDNQTFPEDLGTPLYYNILAKQHLFDRHWDTLARVSYLLGKSTGSAAGTFVSFDDIESMTKKAAQVAANQMRGVIIWEITGDYLESAPGSGVVGGTPLVDTINKIFCHSIGLREPVGDVRHNPLQVNIFPTPTSAQTTIRVWSDDPGPGSIIITDMNGRMVVQQEFNHPSAWHDVVLSLDRSATGVYLVTVATLHDRVHARLIVRR